MASPPNKVVRYVKPVLSLNNQEARNRVMALYKSCIRQCRFVVSDYDLPNTEKSLRNYVRNEFLKHKDVKDVRVIDYLIIKGHMTLNEVFNNWQTAPGLMYNAQETVEPKPSTFLDKFMRGND